MGLFSIHTKIMMDKDDLREILQCRKNVYIVTDSYMEKSGKVGYLTEELDQLGVNWKIFSEVIPNPDIQLLTKGVLEIQKFQPDFLVAFGGGSAIDAAKGMRYFARKMGILTGCPLLAVPTTSGTGSEVTRYAVITDEQQEIKYPMAEESLLPDYALLDAALVQSVPPAVTADTGMDVITHAIEAYVAANATEFSRKLAVYALKLAVENLPKVHKNPKDLYARNQMHIASCMAGMAFDNSGLGLNHAMAHILGARWKLSHGRANAVLLPYVIAHNSGITKEYHSKFHSCAELYSQLGEELKGEGGNLRQNVLFLIHRIEKLNRMFQIPERLEGLYTRDEFWQSIPEMAEIALKDHCMEQNPVECTKEEVQQIFQMVWSGRGFWRRSL